MNELLITLPPMFAKDHAERECLTGEIHRETYRGITYRITDRETFNDWYSDADLYSTPGQFDAEYKALCASALRAYAILHRRIKDACSAWGHDSKGGRCRYCSEATDDERELLTASFPQHDQEYPHGIGCPACRRLRHCNECGRALGTTTKYAVRNGKRYAMLQGCTNGRCPLCCTAVCQHAENQR